MTYEDFKLMQQILNDWDLENELFLVYQQQEADYELSKQQF
jgi:hypothetical protein